MDFISFRKQVEELRKEIDETQQSFRSQVSLVYTLVSKIWIL